MIKNQYRMNKRKNSLAQKIIGLLIILVMAGMLEIGFGFVLLDRYRTEIRNMETTVLNSYITRTNQTFNMINSNVRSLLFESTETVSSRNTGDVRSMSASPLSICFYHRLKTIRLSIQKKANGSLSISLYVPFTAAPKGSRVPGSNLLILPLTFYRFLLLTVPV